MKGAVGDWIAGFFLIAMIYVLVRPQSAAADAVEMFSKAMASIVRAITDM